MSDGVDDERPIGSARHVVADDPGTMLARGVKRVLRNAIHALQGTAGAILVPEQTLGPRDLDLALAPDAWAASIEGRVPELFHTIGLRQQARRALYGALSDAMPMARAGAGQSVLPVRRLTALLESGHGLPDAPLLDRFVVLPVAQGATLIGLIAVLRAALDFTPAEERLLDAFAGQVASSIANTLLVQELVQEHDYAETAITQSAEGILGIDAKRRIVTFNPAMELLTGRRRSEAMGKPWDDVLILVAPDSGDGSGFTTIAAALADTTRLAEERTQPGRRQRRMQVEAVLVAHDGERTHVTVAASVTHEQGGTFAGATLYVRDITGARQVEQLRTAFLSLTSHELQTPVAIIKAYAETIQRRFTTMSDDVLPTALEAIIEECDRLSRLIANLLRVSRIEAGALALQKVPLDLPALIRRVVRRHAPRAGAAFQFRVDVPAGFPVVIADEGRIEEVLANLVENAVKYSPHGGVISISAHYPSVSGGDEIEVHVQDQGSGIPLRDMDHLFERFYRTGSATASRAGGAGLGLYLCRAIVRAHGGELHAQSTWGKGSTFAFTLPRTGRGDRQALPLERTLALGASTKEEPRAD